MFKLSQNKRKIPFTKWVADSFQPVVQRVSFEPTHFRFCRRFLQYQSQNDRTQLLVLKHARHHSFVANTTHGDIETPAKPICFLNLVQTLKNDLSECDASECAYLQQWLYQALLLHSATHIHAHEQQSRRDVLIHLSLPLAYLFVSRHAHTSHIHSDETLNILNLNNPN